MWSCLYIWLIFVNYTSCWLYGGYPPVRVVKENDLRGKIDELCPSYKISFSIYVNSYTAIKADSSGSADFLHLTDTEGDVLVFRTNQGGTFQLKTNPGSGIQAWNSPSLPKQKWYSIELEQTFKNNRVYSKEVWS